MTFWRWRKERMETAPDGETGELHPLLSPGVRNLVKRARQITDIRWTPVGEIIGWKDREANLFHAGTAYSGIPYGQPHRSGSYVPWETDFPEFLRQVRDPDSPMFSQRSVSQIQRNPSAFYSCECSAFVSWAWGLQQRETTLTLERFGSVLKGGWEILQVGDCLLREGKHCVLVTDMTLDASGAVTGIEISEERQPTARRRWYRASDPERPLSALQTDYLERGYEILRFHGRDGVGYLHSCAVPLEGDLCPRCGCNPFRDVRLDAWYAPAVAFVCNQSWMTGTASDRFEPEQPISRNTFIDILRNCAVPSVRKNEDALSAAARKQFGGSGETCTRAELVSLLWQAFGRPRANGEASPFRDVKGNEAWEPAVLWAAEQGILERQPGSCFAPNQNATRAEAAQLVYRACLRPVGSSEL